MHRQRLTKNYCRDSLDEDRVAWQKLIWPEPISDLMVLTGSQRLS